MRKVRTTLSSRRQFLAAAAAVVPTILPSRSWATPTIVDDAAADPKPSVLIVGDSMIAGGFGLYLANEMKAQGFATRRHGKSSTGLARPDFYDWPKQVKRMVREEPPDASIVMFGGNDVQGLYMGRGEWIRWPDEGWSAEYARRVDAFSDILAPHGESLYWIGLPTMRPEPFRERVQRVNEIYRERMTEREGASFIDVWNVLANEDGEYADRIYLEPEQEGARRTKVRVRASDGIHLSRAGAQRLTDHVLNVLLPALSTL